MPDNQMLVGHGTDLADFLFGSERNVLTPLRDRLLDIQKRRCFYCDGGLEVTTEVDHFIPWSRYPRDLGHNFVLTHALCNFKKRDFLADVPHLARWRARNETCDSDLQAMFADVGVFHDLQTSLHVAEWAYEQVESVGGVVWAHGAVTHALDHTWRDALFPGRQT